LCQLGSLSFAIKEGRRAEPSETFRFSAAVAGFGMMLTQSKHNRLPVG